MSSGAHLPLDLIDVEVSTITELRAALRVAMDDPRPRRITMHSSKRPGATLELIFHVSRAPGNLGLRLD